MLGLAPLDFVVHKLFNEDLLINSQHFILESYIHVLFWIRGCLIEKGQCTGTECFVLVTNPVSDPSENPLDVLFRIRIWVRALFEPRQQ